MKQLIKLSAFFLLVLVVFASCKKEKPVTVPPVSNYNQPPVANAGVSQCTILPTDRVELGGSGTDADGYIVSYSWTKISGPSTFIIVNPNAAATQVKNLVEGFYVFELKVTDNSGLNATAKVGVSVSVIDLCCGCWDY